MRWMALLAVVVSLVGCGRSSGSGYEGLLTVGEVAGDLGVDRPLRKKVDREWAEADGSLAVVHWVTETLRYPQGRKVVTIFVKLGGADDLANLLEHHKGDETVGVPRLGEGAFAYTERVTKWIGVAFEDGGRLVEVVYIPFEKTEATPEKLGQVVELAARAKERLADLE